MDKTSSHAARKAIEALKNNNVGASGTLKKDQKRSCKTWTRTESKLKITNELRRFTEVDNHEEINIGDRVKNSEAIKLGKPKFYKQMYQNGAIREGVCESTLREGDAGKG